MIRYFGADEKGEKGARHLKQIVDGIFEAFATVIIGDYVPSLWWVSKLQGVEAPLQDLCKRMKQFAQGILDEHRRDNAPTDHQDSTYNDKPKDFIVCYFLSVWMMGLGNFPMIQLRLFSMYGKQFLHFIHPKLIMNNEL